jgi:YVTN family beta-propeller protein
LLLWVAELLLPAGVTGDTVSVIDTATNAVATTVAAGSDPYGVAVNPAGTFVYVAKCSPT